MPRRLLALAACAACLAGGALTAAIAEAGPATRALRVGALTLHRCGDGYPGFCGDVRRALDPGLRGGPTIPIRLEWIPARDHAAHAPTIVAVEGGPGYPSTGSFAEYTGTFGRVEATDNLLMVDNRGTGDSALIRCAGLDRYPAAGTAVGPRFDALVGACARHLDHLYRAPDGHFIHAADLFATEYAVSDLDAVLTRLHTGRVTLYGDSYGSWFAQAFMARFPQRLRAVILDSTYAIHRLDPYYASSGLSARAAMDRVCARGAVCRAAAGAGAGTPVARLGRLLARVRRRPIRGSVRGVRRPVAVTPRALVNIVQNGGSDPYAWRELDASVRAALAGAPAPMLRLVASEADNGGDEDAGYFSDGDYMAVSCTDYPQLFSLDASRAERHAQLRRSVRAAPPGAFAPFTAREWVSMSGYSETYDACLDWPRTVHRAPVIAPVGARALPARVPVLVVGGDLDDLTPLHDARRFTPTLGAEVRVVDLRNTVHVTSEGDTYLTDGAACARSVIDRFVADPAGLRRLDAACAAAIPPLQTPDYPARLAAAAPARVTSGGPPPAASAREAVTVAAGALADVATRQAESGARRGAGLYGGSWRRVHGELHLAGIRFVPDATVSGSGRDDGGAISARLIVRARGLRVAVSLRWTERSRSARARVGPATLVLPAP